MANRDHEDSTLRSEAPPESFRRPVQEMEDQNSVAADTVQLLMENPAILAQVLVRLRYLKVIGEKTTDWPEGSKLQAIGTVLLAVACGSYSGTKFLIALLFTTLSDFVKMEAEIPKEKIGEYDRMKRSFKEEEVKLKEVEQDVGKMKEEVELIFWRCVLFVFSFKLFCCSFMQAFDYFDMLRKCIGLLVYSVSRLASPKPL